MPTPAVPVKMKIVSGGQTGVDRAALDAALSLGVPAGGFCPAGRRAEDGPIPRHYPVQELPGAGYVERTAANVREADGTVIFHPGLVQGGTRATADFCREMKKPALLLDARQHSPESAARALEDFVRQNRIVILNVAGPRRSQWPAGSDYTRAVLAIFLRSWNAGPPPKISFVVPAHNEEHELPATLRALRAAADQAGESYELLVVDDASTDATAEIARSFDARVLTVQHRQIAAARNAGGRAARGEILFFVDADTHIAPEHVSGALEVIAAGGVGGGARVAMEGQLPVFTRLLVGLFSALYFGAGLGAGAFLFARRESFAQAGGFDEQYFAGEEVYFSLALRRLGRFRILPRPVVTSARKLRMHRPGFLFGQTLLILAGGPRALRKRERLALWYDGKRERPKPAPIPSPTPPSLGEESIRPEQAAIGAPAAIEVEPTVAGD